MACNAGGVGERPVKGGCGQIWVAFRVEGVDVCWEC